MGSRFVGREVELGELAGRLDDALAGRTTVVLVAGEPGIGKTRLATELGRLAGARGVPVPWGRCTDADGAPAYWPWRGVLRACSAEVDALGPADAGQLARIVPGLGPAPGAAENPAERFALFDAATALLRATAAPGGLVVVLDDLQWADPASLALLAHLARESVDARLMLIALYRAAEVAADPARRAAVADLARHPGGVALELAGLRAEEVAAALTERLGGPPGPAVLAAVTRRTAGNPFFVGEVARALAAGADPDRVPAVVRDVVRRRLDRLPAGCRTVLRAAAVLGADVDPVLLGARAGAVPDGLGPAVEDGLLERPPGRLGLRFVHDLVRETLLAEVPEVERAAVHARAVAALEPLADEPDVLPELARHALAALPDGDPAVAVTWARRAADLALTRLAYEDAARLWHRAADAGRGLLPAGERARLLVSAGRAHGLAHDVAAAVRACADAAVLARHARDAEALGLAALALPGVSELGWLDVTREWCEDALRGLPEDDSPLRARLHAQLAHTMVMRGDPAGCTAVSAGALAMAERVDDPPALVSALRARQLARSDIGGNAERLVLGGRMLAVATRTGDPEDALWGHLWRFDALLQAGRVADAEAELGPIEALVARLRRPMVRLHLLRSRVALAFGRGRFAEALADNDEALEIAQRGHHVGAEMTARTVHFRIEALTGADTLDEGVVAAFPDVLRLPFTALARGVVALWHLAAGRRDDAARWYTGLPRPGDPGVPPFMANPLEVVRAVLAADLGDPDGAAGAYTLLAPHADLHAVGGAGAVTTSGSMQLFLGLGATGAGRPDAAVRHLRAAVAADDAAGFAPFAALARYRLAVALRARGRAADADEAVALAAEAAAVAQRLGMAPLRRAAAALTAAPADGGVLSRREAEIAALVGRGLTNRQIAASAHISERTVESHVQHILAKLGFTGRSQIAAWVARRPF